MSDDLTVLVDRLPMREADALCGRLARFGIGFEVAQVLADGKNVLSRVLVAPEDQPRAQKVLKPVTRGRLGWRACVTWAVGVLVFLALAVALARSLLPGAATP